MPHFIQNILGALTPLFSQQKLIKMTRQKLLLPFYHTVAVGEQAHIKHLYQLRSLKQFEEDLNYFQKYFQSISSDDLLNDKVDKPSFHLTFDDGLREIYHHIAPLLERRGIHATFFVNTSFVDNKGLFYRYKISLIIDALRESNHCQIAHLLECENEYDVIRKALLKLNYAQQGVINKITALLKIDIAAFLAEKQPYLTSAQLLDLQSRGFTIASHGTDHPWFMDIDYEDQKQQLIESFQFLNPIIEDRPRLFSFPFSDEGVSTTFMNWMYEVEHVKKSFGVFGLKKDAVKGHLHRIPIERTIESIQHIIKKEYLYYIAKSFVSKNEMHRND